MSALNNLRRKGIFLTQGGDELLAEMVRINTCFHDKTSKEYREWKKKSLKRKNETIVSWPIIISKHSMPFPNVKYISLALYIVCVIKKWLHFGPN